MIRYTSTYGDTDAPLAIEIAGEDGDVLEVTSGALKVRTPTGACLGGNDGFSAIVINGGAGLMWVIDWGMILEPSVPALFCVAWRITTAGGTREVAVEWIVTPRCC